MTDAGLGSVVMFSTADWYWPYWTNKQHTALHLAERGYEVLYIESVGIRPPGLNAIDVRRIAKRLWRGLRPAHEVRRNVWLLSPLTIPLGHRIAAIQAFNAWQLRRRIRSWLRRRGRPIVWTYHPYMNETVDDLAPVSVVYHCVDNLGVIPGVDQVAYDREEGRLLARADHVFATSPALRDRCAASAPATTHYFANVADVDHFATARREDALPDDLAAIPAPRLMYVGVISDFKIDLGLIDELAERRPDWHIVFIGDEREGQKSPAVARLAARANVHFLGWRPYEQLPAYLRGAAVALLPQSINDYTRAMFPMKFFEYLSAGRPVVATPLPALAEFSAYHRIAANPSDFIAATASALAEAESGAAALRLDHPLLRTYSWQARLDQMLAIVGRQITSSG